MPVEVGDAGPADASAIGDLVERAYRPYVGRIGREPAPMLADVAALIGAGRVRVARMDRVVCGVIVMWVEADHLYVDAIAVDPPRQGSGIGAALLADADRAAADSGRAEIRLYTNAAMTENLSYYPRRDFVETHRGDQDGYHRVFFVRRLSARTE